MAVEEFKDRESAYAAWVEAHPQGWVLNLRAREDVTYVVLHRASCSTINPRRNIPQGAFTQRAYIKICSEDLDSLASWATGYRRNSAPFSKRCRRCKA